MIPTPQCSPPPGQGGGLFRTVDGKNLFLTFALVTSLFLLWGFCNGMIDILNKHFQDSLHINKEQSGLVQFANYLAYFLMAIPAGLIARKFGYKGGILVGLVLIAGGAFWFIHAVGIGHVLGVPAGIVCHCGGHDVPGNHRQSLYHGAGRAGTWRDAHQHRPDVQRRRLDSRPDCRRIFCVCRPSDGANANAGLSTPYLGIGIFAALLLVVFTFGPVPDLHAVDESKKSADQKAALKPSGGQLAGIGIALVVVWGLLYFFIAPILGLVWTLLNLPANLLDPTKYGLIVVAYIGSFMVVSRNWDMFRRKHFTLGVVTQFLYVAAQTGIFSFCVNYIMENDASVTAAKASYWLGAIGFVLFAAGRTCGSAMISQFKPNLVLAAYAVINVVLTAVAMGGGKPGLSPCLARSSSCPSCSRRFLR